LPVASPNLALGNGPLILDARKLANAERAISIDDRAFGRSPPAKCLDREGKQGLLPFRYWSRRPTSGYNRRQLDQWRRGSLSVTGCTLENTSRLETEAPHAIDIIDREKKVDRGERLVVLPSPAARANARRLA